MAITYHAGRRIQGTSTDFGTAGAGIPAVAGGWKELGRTTLGSAGDIIDIASLPNKRYYMVLENILGDSGEVSPEITFNGDTGTNYPIRRSNNGGTDWTSTTYNYMYNAYGGTISDRFIVGYIANQSDKEKLYQHHQCINVNRSNAGTEPDRNELAAKWVNTSSSIDQITVTNSGGGSFDTGAEVVVLGFDPADTHSTNFWEELADISLTSTNTSLDSGTFTAKKYLWVQMYQKGMTGNNTLYNFNSDTGSNYARRWRIDGGTEWTTPSTTGLMCHNAVGTQTDNFFNMFIVNNSANEKLVISSSVYTISTGAGSPPSREEHVGKWDNTSSQITSIQFDHGGSNFGIGSSIKVWGSD